MTKSVQQKICDEFSFLEGVVSEYYFKKIVEKAYEIYDYGVDAGADCNLLNECYRDEYAQN